MKLITSELNDTVDITLIALTPSSLLMRTKYQLPGVRLSITLKGVELLFKIKSFMNTTGM